MAATLAGIFVWSEGGMQFGAEAPKAVPPVVGEGSRWGASHVDARLHATAALRASAATPNSFTYIYSSFAATKGFTGTSCGSLREGRPDPEPAASCRGGLAAIRADPGAMARPAWQCGAQGRALRPGLGSGLGPWIGASGCSSAEPYPPPRPTPIVTALGSAPITR